MADLPEIDSLFAKLPSETHDQREIKTYLRTYVEQFGGLEEYREHLLRNEDDLAQSWGISVDVMGRILRAHLYIEHFLGKYLQAANPQLGSVSDARLSYDKKLKLCGKQNSMLNALMPGLKYLNVVRNRVVHELRAEVTESDAAVFRGVRMYAPFAKINGNATPIELLEGFAQLAGRILAGMGDLRDQAAHKNAFDYMWSDGSDIAES